MTVIMTWLICIFQKLEYHWNKKRYLKIVNSIVLLMQAACLCYAFRHSACQYYFRALLNAWFELNV